ncbi:MAG: PilW family protein [Pseudomonadota bacterium]|nr:PilW family protein [Pseudomonadota bacterium]
MVQWHGRQKGIGLVEIMVALVIGSLLVAGVVQIFVSNRQAYDLQGELAKLQENGRFAFQFLTEDLRMAGYMGCSRNLEVGNNLNNPDQYAYELDGEPLIGFYVDSSGNLSGATIPTGLDLGTLTPNTDVVMIRRAGDGAVDLRPPYRDQAKPANTLVLQGHDLQIGDIVVISDCTDATIVQLTGSSNDGNNSAIVHAATNNSKLVPGNSTKDLGHNYGEGATVSRMLNVIYYIDDGVDGSPALFRKVGTSASEELMGGVEEFRLTYGLDTNQDGTLDTKYMTAKEIDDDLSSAVDWSNVIAVRMDVLMRGDSAAVVDTGSGQNLVFAGSVVNYKDGFLRQGMSSTVTVRNRVP